MRTIAFAVCVGVLAAVPAMAGPFFIAVDNFESYPVGSAVHGQGGWSQSNGGSGSSDYTIVGGGGAGGTNGISNCPSGSNQINWTAHPWDWGTLAVGDWAVARMDFQANGSGQFDDDRVGWVLASNPGSSSYHFGVQLDTPDGGLVTYLRDLGGSGVKNVLIANALLGATGSNWYRETLIVTKLTSALGPGGARIDVSLYALDANGSLVGPPVTGSTLLDTSAYRGFSGTVYPMYKNYNAQPGNADSALFAVVPEPASLGLLAAGGVLALLRRRHR